MFILGIETSARIGGVALIGDKDLVVEYRLNTGMRHSERLMIAIDRLLGDAGIRLEDLGGIAISIGPGSFTGLRVGLSTAKGISAATGKPIIPVPTLDAMAHNIRFSRCLICPMIDARKKEVYAAIFEPINDSGIRRITDYMVNRPEKILDYICDKAIFLGDGAEVYHDLIVERLSEKALFAPRSLSHSAVAVAEIGSDILRNGFKHEEILTPLYLRKSEAEIKSHECKRGIKY